jgi:hypothetical protein
VTQGADETIRLREEVIWRELEGQVLVLNPKTWNYLGVNGTGTELWPLVVEGATRKQLVGHLTNAYGVTAEAAERDVAAFVESLSDLELLRDA